MSGHCRCREEMRPGDEALITTSEFCLAGGLMPFLNWVVVGDKSGTEMTDDREREH